MVLERIFRACRSRRLSVYIQEAIPGRAEDAHRPQAKISSLEHQIVASLLANFPLWARAPPEFQFGLVTSVLDVVRDAPELFRQSLPLQLVLDSVRVCYPDESSADAGRPTDEETGISGLISSDTTSESSADESETIYSTDNSWTSLARKERLHMRGFLWEIVRLLLGRTVSEQDGEALVQFMASCNDERLVRLRLVMASQHNGPQGRKFLVVELELTSGNQGHGKSRSLTATQEKGDRFFRQNVVYLSHLSIGFLWPKR